jgi:hypothetical protein
MRTSGEEAASMDAVLFVSLSSFPRKISTRKGRRTQGAGMPSGKHGAAQVPQ